MIIKEELRALYARLDDLVRCAERGEMGVSSFLSPRETHYARSYLTQKGVMFRDFGGYASAERNRMYIFPDYMEGIGGSSESKETEPTEQPEQIKQIKQIKEEKWLEEIKDFGYSSEIAALRIQGSGYRKLTHRDFLGSLLGLGLDRSVLGDILTDGEEGKSAVVFCDALISVFIENEMTVVANDKVKIHRLKEGEWQLPERRFATIHDTVASPRLDAVVAALCGISREKARDTVCGDMVEMNFESEDRPDHTVEAPCMISVRGFGRYRILSLTDRTKKGRYRLEAEKYL